MLRIIATENGKVRGLPASDPRVTAFKGIPFAAPPVGRNRWRAPQPCESWEGVRDCFAFAPISVQDTPSLGTDIYCREWHVDSEIPMGEDNLYLNIWTGTKTGNEKMPVLVWYFGGGFQWGYTAEMEFDGERLARRGIVVVTVNYRLGALGFLAHPQLSREQPEAPANFGVLDQQAGLQWVRRNISAFGGDPENITIAGQSAGGGSVMAQMACKKNEGCFQKAIVMSGMIRSPYAPDPFMVPKTLSEAEKLGAAFFDYLGVSTLEEARELDAFLIRDRYAAFRKDHPFFTVIADGVFCDRDPMRAFAEGSRVRVPVMAGNTEDEFFSSLPAEDEAGLKAAAERCFGEKAAEYLAFPEARRFNTTPWGTGAGAVSSIEHAVKASFLGEKAQPGAKACWYYRFMPDIPGEDHPGTFHSCDLWFFFDTLYKCSRPYRGRHFDLARQMSLYWVNFIRTGDPNGLDDDGTPLPEWKEYTKEDRCEMLFTSHGAESTEEEEGFRSFLTAHILDSLTR